MVRSTTEPLQTLISCNKWKYYNHRSAVPLRIFLLQHGHALKRYALIKLQEELENDFLQKWGNWHNYIHAPGRFVTMADHRTLSGSLW